MQEIPLRVPYEGFSPQEFLSVAALFVTDIALLLTNHSPPFSEKLVGVGTAK